MSHRDKLVSIPIPRFPRPTGGNMDQRYVDQLVDALETAFDIIESTRQGEFSEITLTSLQGHGANLRIGDVFEDDGILKIVRSGEAFAASFVGTSAVGSVTVSTP